MTVINRVREAYVDPRQTEELNNALTIAQAITTGGAMLGTATAIFGLLLARNHPIIGSFFVIPGALTALACREANVMSGNALSISDGVTSRATALYSSSSLADTLVNRTWIVKPFFRDTVRVLLDKS